ncbi:glycoside hydrolase family 2 TIM barrel-domain containing protein [Paenibacillus cisolokensis]|uniref:glycoside hydrolase family 2 TIM barrel-domain containing protein n=1 Tax=Paenibacillus cisolokensis TaxID=1658519 RepID=UPI003D2CF6E9
MTMAAEQCSRKVACFNTGWRFAEGNYAGAHRRDYHDQDWRRLDVPHDWSIEKPFDPEMPYGGSQAYLPRWSVGWYRKHVHIPASASGQRVSIRFDGIHNNSEVWINGHLAGTRPYGYVSVQYDLTPYIRWGEDNVIAVKVDNTVMPPDRWYSGSGIYRNVWLIMTGPLHVAAWGTYITTPEITDEAARVHIRIKLDNKAGDEAECLLVTELLDADGQRQAQVETTVSISARSTMEVEQEAIVRSPKLWSPDHPQLYEARTVILRNGQVIDDVTTSYGIREIRLDSQAGLLLNGQRLKLKGVCIHHDLGCLGAAYHDQAMERRLAVLKEMGCNAIRFAHNPMAPELLDLCDRMGFLVINEAFDKWKSLYYAAWFDEWWEQDLEAMLIRDRNHPCVLMWSLGNEVENQGQPAMLDMLRKLANYCREKDPTRPVTCALEPHNTPLSLRDGPIEAKVEHTKKLAECVDILGLNYQEQWYEHYREAMPDTLIVGTETFPYYRGHGNRVKGYWPVNPWFDVEKHDYVIGQFVWVGIDYLGEAAYPSKGWSSGLIDTCGFRKPISYLQQSLWSDKPMVHMAVLDETLSQERSPQWTMHWKSPPMASHWTFPQHAGKMIRLVTFTNCDSVELFVNGESYGIRRLEDYPDRMIIWHLPYIPGTIRAIGRSKDRELCKHELTTAGKPHRLLLKPDLTVLTADGHSISHVEVQVVDEQGVVVPGHDANVRFDLAGEGVIAGVDNGDLTSDEPYKSNCRTTRNGKCLVIIRAKREAGSLLLTAYAEGLLEGTARFEVQPSEPAAEDVRWPEFDLFLPPVLDAVRTTS